MAAGKGKGRWTRSEIDAARSFGTERIPNNGFGQPDFVVPPTNGNPQIACQVKTKAVVPAWLESAVSQSVLDAEGLDDEAVPAVVIVHAAGAGIKRKRYMLFRFEDAVKLLMPNAEGESARPPSNAGPPTMAGSRLT